jgi:hypothetical protein
VDRVRSENRILDAVVSSLFPDLKLDTLGAAEAGSLPSLGRLITAGVCDILAPTHTISKETGAVVNMATELRRHVPPTGAWHNLPDGFAPGLVAQIEGTAVKRTDGGQWLVMTDPLRTTAKTVIRPGMFPLSSFSGADLLPLFQNKTACLIFTDQPHVVISDTYVS